MQVTIPLFMLSVLVHLAIFITSLQPDRHRKLWQGLLVMVLAFPVAALEQFLEGGGMASRWLAPMAIYAPHYMPFLSFLVYLGRRGNVYTD